MSDHSEIVKVLSNIRSLRVFARETEFDSLLDMYEKLGSVIEERREDAEREARERAEREKKRQELLQIIAGEGFTPEELAGNEVDTKSKRTKRQPSNRPAKYRFTDPETGKEETWTGIGRMKKGLQTLVAEGRQLEDFLVGNS